MSNALPQAVADYLESPAGQEALVAGAVWFRWNLQMRKIESSGHVLRSPPEQMSRPRTTVFFKAEGASWKRYA